MKIGVLASQGAFAEHIAILRQLGIDAMPVRLPRELEGLEGLIIPGGESTTISKLMRDYNLTNEIRKLANNGLPILGTCAGMIILANGIADPRVKTMGVMNIKVKRNAFGRQVDSFEADLPMPSLGDKTFRGVFIRAPIVQKTGAGVEILCQVNNKVVAARQGKMLACAFHPELTDDLRFHRYFLNLVGGDAVAKNNSR